MSRNGPLSHRGGSSSNSRSSASNEMQGRLQVQALRLITEAMGELSTPLPCNPLRLLSSRQACREVHKRQCWRDDACTAASEATSEGIEPKTKDDNEQEKFEFDEQHDPEVTLSSRRMTGGTGRGGDLYLSLCRRTGVVSHQRIGNELRSEVLAVANRHVGDRSAYPLTAALVRNSCVQKIDVSFNSLGADGGSRLFAALIANSTVNELNVSGNDLGRTEAVAFLAELMRRNCYIKHLDIARNALSEDDAKYIAVGLKENDTLLSLNASHNEFRLWGAKYMARALTINDALEELDLSWNHIRKEGAVAIGLAMQNNSGLKTLLLSSNGLGYEGSVAMQHALERNWKLERLDVSSNSINWDGALMFAEAIDANATLKELVIGNNPLTTTGAMDLIDAISSNQASAICLLDISGVSVTKDFVSVVADIRENRPEFACRHGVVVSSPDVLGARKAREQHPMAKVLLSVHDRQLRPLEVVREFDKSVSFVLEPEEFARRVKKFSKDLKTWEVHELVNYVQESGEPTTVAAAAADGADVISHVNFSKSVHRFIAEERAYRISQRKKAARIRKRKQDCLNSVTLPAIDMGNSITSISADLETEVDAVRVVRRFLSPRRQGFH